MPTRRRNPRLIRKVITETVHPSDGGPPFKRHRTVYVLPGKTDKARAKVGKLFGVRDIEGIEDRFNQLDIPRLKEKKDDYKKRIVDINRKLLEGGLDKARVKELKDLKRHIRAKRNLLKRVLKHKKAGSRAIENTDLSSFAINSSKVSETAKVRIKALIQSDMNCAKLNKAKVLEREPLSGGCTHPEKLILEGGGYACFKPVKNERHLREAVPKGAFFLREICAYEVDKILDFGLVPYTTYKVDSGRVGSAQNWVKGKKGGSLDRAKLREVLDSEDGLKMGLFDSLIGNTDRHGNNWIFGGDKPNAIDNGLAFCEEKKLAGNRSPFMENLTSKSQKIPEKYLRLLSNKKEALLSCVGDYLGHQAKKTFEFRLNYVLENKKIYDEWGGAW